jgi:PPE-repeat protein
VKESFVTIAPIETWIGYPPELNATRFEMGTGPGSWEDASAIWTELGALVTTSLGTISANIAMMTGVSLQGLTSVAMAGSSVPFLTWLMEMGGLAAVNALACATVGAAWATTTAGMIPSPVVLANRVAEMNAEATNFFGINTPIIIELNREYGQFWTQNGGTMMTYDQAVALATTPKFAPPPPILSSGTGASQMMDSAMQVGEQAAQAGQQAAQIGQQAAQQTGQQAGQQAGQSSSGMEQLPQQVGSQLQQVMQSFMQQPGMGTGLDGAFTPALASAGSGLPLGGSGLGAGGGMGAGGFGGGGFGSGPLGTLSGNNAKVVNASNSTGVPAPIGSGSKATTSGTGPMGGAPMHGAGRNGEGSRGKHETIIAADQESVYEEMSIEEERRLFG